MVSGLVFVALASFFHDEQGHPPSRVIMTLSSSFAWLLFVANAFRAILHWIEAALPVRRIGTR